MAEDSEITLEKIIGFAFMIFGIIWALFERSLCKFLCPACTGWQISPCFLLFLFVGIVFVIIGVGLIKIPSTQLPKVKFSKVEGTK